MATPDNPIREEALRFCSSCKWRDDGAYLVGETAWCSIQYKSCCRGRQEDADCGPDGKLWEAK